MAGGLAQTNQKLARHLFAELSGVGIAWAAVPL